jgi:diguanylate cyclase (GGDEF)-like protein
VHSKEAMPPHNACTLVKSGRGMLTMHYSSKERSPLDGAVARARSTFSRHVLAITFALCVSGIVGLGSLAFYLFDRSQQSDALVLQTVITIGNLERLHLTLVEAESAGRAFLVTASQASSSLYQSKIKGVDDELRDFRQVTANNAAQQELIQDLEQHISSRFAFLEGSMRIRAAQGFDAMRKAGIGPGGKEMRWIKARIGLMKDAEVHRWTQGQHTQRKRDDHLRLSIGLLVVLGVGVLSILFWYLKRLSLARQRAETAAIHEAHHDALTGLPNRRLLHDRMAIALARAEREQLQLALLSMDLDGFKHVNDTYGHDAGDELLKQVSGRLAKLVRSHDTAARMGGDEFVLELFPVRDISEVNRVSARVAETLSAPYQIGGHQLTIGTSIGVALYPRDGANEEQLMKRADLALYAAKKSGRTPGTAKAPRVPVRAEAVGH